MLINAVEYSQNKSHVEVVKNTKTAVVENNKVRSFGIFLYLEIFEIEYGIIKLIIKIIETYIKR